MERVLIVGAGLAGLTCGQILAERGWDVQILEAAEDVGGRVRSDEVAGFKLDQGFQVLFTAYPAARRRLDFGALDLRAFDPGGIIARGRRRAVLADPLRDPGAALPSGLTSIISPLDKVRTALLALRLRTQAIPDLLRGPDESTMAFLQRWGFSERYINYFIRPFYGGIFLNRSLSISAKCFKFDFKMLSEGQVVVPAAGIGAIPAQLAAPLHATGRIWEKARVVAVEPGADGRIRGVRLADGTRLEGDTIVVATEGPEAARLTGKFVPPGQVSTVTLYWQGPQPIYRSKKLLLNANSRPFVNNAVQLTNVAPEYAPEGRHLLSASILGVPNLSDRAMFDTAMQDLQRMFTGNPGAQERLAQYEPLAIYRIPYAQFPQPPGIHPTLPANDSGVPGLVLAGEFTEASSQNAALISGEKAAAFILGEPPPTP